MMVFIVDIFIFFFWWGLLGPSCNGMSGNCFCTVCHHQYSTMELNMIKLTLGVDVLLWNKKTGLV